MDPEVKQDTDKPEPFELTSARFGALPVVNHFLDRAGLPALLDRYLPVRDARVHLSGAAAIRLAVTNLLLGRSPLYALAEWAAPYAPGLLGLTSLELAGVNDDRVARALDEVFDADRGSLLTELMLAVIAEFGIDTSELHNDSTSITLHGAHADADGSPVRGKPTVAASHGHSKDHRPDLKQLVWILTVAADGAVPITYRLADGNTPDDPTHVPTWDQLADLLGRTDFLYVADSKLASTAAMSHLHTRGGRFITVLPRTRKEDTWFRHWAQTHAPDWTQAAHLPPARAGAPATVFSVFTSPLPSAEGHRIIWVHSTDKAARDGATRQRRIEAGTAAIEALAERLAGPKTRIKDRPGVIAAADAALTTTGAARWVTYTIDEHTTATYRQTKRGRPGPATAYRRTDTTRFTITADIDLDTLAYDATTDGCFPLITNTTDTDLTATEVLAAYRYQPNLERRHHLLKATQHADPVLLRTPARIEALFCCHFLALLIGALIEREIRTNMATAALADIPLYPELRACPAPSAERIFTTLADLTRHDLHHHGQLVQIFPIVLTDIQTQTLNLLGVPTTDYTNPTPSRN